MSSRVFVSPPVLRRTANRLESARIQMQQMLTALNLQGYPQVSLSVQKANYAARMYEKLGFEIVEDKEEEYIMVHRL